MHADFSTMPYSHHTNNYPFVSTTCTLTHVLQVPAEASSLNSGDCFICVDSEDAYVWQGKNALPEELALGVTIAKKLSKSGAPLIEQQEGAEKEGFWAALGGKTEYPSTGAGDEIAREPRLFEGSTKVRYTHSHTHMYTYTHVHIHTHPDSRNPT